MSEKRQKVDMSKADEGSGLAPNALQNFVLDRVLNESAASKMVVLLGSLQGKEGQAIAILSRRHFAVAPDAVPPMLAGLTLKETMHNDVYAKFEGTLGAEHSAINVDVIHPCNARHISKYSAQKSFVLVETPELYKAATLPHIESIPANAIQWVYNILEKKKEADRMIFEDTDVETGFVLHPDQKWDQTQVDALYCLAIVHRRDVRSLRDLTAAHLPLLENILAKASAAIHDKFGLASDALRVYIHYPPSYYHLHVHFLNAKHDGSYGMAAGKAHALQDVIANIKLMPDFYARASLAVALGENDPLRAKLGAAAAAE